MKLQRWIREHRTTAALTLGLAAALLLEGALLWQLGKTRKAAEWHRPRLVEMENIVNKALALQGRAGSGGPKFLAANSRFSTEAVDRVAREQKIVERVTFPDVKVVKHDGQTNERVVILSINGLEPAQIENFLRAVEALDPAVRTRLMVITPNREKPSLVDAKIEIGAYESASSAT
jgi:hypothetical protein